MDIGQFLQENWTVISQAPWAFIACALLFGGVGFVTANQLSSASEKAKDQRLALAEERVTDYREKLSGATPDEAANKITELEQRLARLEPRRLSEHELRALKVALSAAPNEVRKVKVEFDIASQLAKSIGNQIVSAFEASGWQTERSHITLLWAGPVKHGIVLLTSGDVIAPGFPYISKALDAAGIEYEVEKHSLDDAAAILRITDQRD